jgi:hypothetical protein
MLDINALGQSIDTTFGRSSTPQTATRSIKISLGGGNRLNVSYLTLATVSTDRQMIETKRACEDEAERVVVAAIKKVKQNYKELTGEALKVTPLDNTRSSSVEIVGMNTFSTQRSVYFRYKLVVEVG